MDSSKKLNCMYLATFDPTISVTGTAVRGRMFLKFFAERYHTHLVHMKDKHGEGKDSTLISQLVSINSVEYSPWRYFLFSRTLYRLANKLLSRSKIDFIFADFEKAGWYASMLARKFGVPYIYNTHNVEYQRYISVAKTNPLRYAFVPYIYLIERTACRNALFTVTISEPDAQAFRRWNSHEKVFVLPAAFDESVINPHYSDKHSDVPIVLMVGNYRNAGNRAAAYAMFQDIIPKVLKRHSDTLFRFIGKGFPADIKHPNVQAAGFVDDLRSEYALATVIVAPITMGGGIKIKVVEALASGKFLVTTEKGIEGIDPAGFRNVCITDIEGFADAVSEAIQDTPPKTLNNWDTIASRFGIHGALLKLATHIESAIPR